ncbi:MAG: hypothetical protein H7Y42_09875 [Chitinophagaceae bacterium]|nr:hypothetical protein [Chitinophagaceae bacterium]
MRINRSSDILINVFFPVIIGYSLYVLLDHISLPNFARNYFSDAVWAYAFLSAILIMWNRHLNFTWIVISFLLSTCFELLQFLSWVGGTGDIFDVLTYYFSFGIALSLNAIFRRAYTRNNKSLTI